MNILGRVLLRQPADRTMRCPCFWGWLFFGLHMLNMIAPVWYKSCTVIAFGVPADSPGARREHRRVLVGHLQRRANRFGILSHRVRWSKCITLKCKRRNAPRPAARARAWTFCRRTHRHGAPPPTRRSEPRPAEATKSSDSPPHSQSRSMRRQ